MPDLDVRNTKTYTMRELTQHTAQVMEEINRSQRSAVITKHGRIVALVLPLEDAEIQRLVISAPSPLVQELESRAAEAEASGGRTYSSDEVAALLRERDSTSVGSPLDGV